MSRLNVYDMSGASVGELEVPDSTLELNKGAQAVKDVVTASRNARRSGTACTLSKGEVAGSNKKPWKQKGTGRARAGLRQSPLWRGGGVAFGPKPRSYAVKVNKKVAQLAFRRAFSEAIRDGKVRVLDGLAVGEPKTRVIAGMMKKLGIGAPALMVVGAENRNLALSVRNLPRVELATAAGVGVYQLVRHPTIVVTRDAMEKLQARMAGAAASDSAVQGKAESAG
jgi:large subunit ribosomal protein L4